MFFEYRPERGQKGASMKLKRGIFCGTIVIVGSFSGFFEIYNTKGISACWPYMLSLFLGVMQIGLSLEYENPLRKRILQICFGIEGVYCAGAVLYLLNSSTDLGTKIFGMLIAMVYFTMITSSIYTICSAVPIGKEMRS